MCSIFGYIGTVEESPKKTQNAFWELIEGALSRGRDGVGISNIGALTTVTKHIPLNPPLTPESLDLRELGGFFSKPGASVNLIGNTRAEPTTEYVAQKTHEDQQPYRAGNWTVVHNGTIANDKELRTHRIATRIDSAAIAEILENEEPSPVSVRDAAQKIQGSFAFAAQHALLPGTIFLAANYRPVWFVRLGQGYAFGSSRHMLSHIGAPHMLEPYSVAELTEAGLYRSFSLIPGASIPKRALVICSGGLDSVVAAAALKHRDVDVELAHFTYGSRAEKPERAAVAAAADYLGAKLHYLPMNIYDPKDSPLLRADSNLAGGEEGAEFAHEWVPARNLVMLALATAYAEANGFDHIALGNNMEEAGAYPDNEPEFIDRFNDLLPFAVGAGRSVRMLMPVGNLMKHEIVALGHRVGAPMHLTWSCYRAGNQHCGTCGPCYMRRTAFEINRLKDPITYERG